MIKDPDGQDIEEKHWFKYKFFHFFATKPGIY